ncbi:metallophosphoesterase family protein [Rhizobium laguerreae]|uniref:metallophosphoesterase family protein n=1 Tax=Rhizobium laguerreae TaxID=1076926 RepID=UPI001C90C75F|nr:metallophosphoesterase [Rhizobium laguerreae]MBY3383217.1 metallophosphoesterase [Rhizobium laguerreae]
MSEDFETSRDPTLSIFQSLVEDVAEKLEARKSTGRRSLDTMQRSARAELRDVAIDLVRMEEGRLTSDDIQRRDLTKGQIARVCAELALRYIKALAKGDAAALHAIKAEYETGTCDTEWISTLEAYHSYFGPNGDRAQIPYIRPATIGSKIIPLKNDAIIGLFADWGTGETPALDVLTTIVTHKPDALIHLGDIYYSGTPKECRENFVEPIERKFRQGEPKPVFTLAGNHDMYCGGVGFYEMVGKLNPAPYDQAASFFCLRSMDEKWQFLAMDTGLHDYSPYGVSDVLTRIEEDELAWHVERMSEFQGKTILLSHHQLFSAYSKIGQDDGNGKRKAVNANLLRAYEAIASKGNVAAWFWGHEHSLSIYQPFTELKRGRCIGHAAIPVNILDEIYKNVDGLDSVPNLIADTMQSTVGNLWSHGYALLSLRDQTCTASYYELTATGGERQIFHETF